MNSDTVFVKILDKEYQVACRPEERQDLLQAAQQLDQRMRDIRIGGTVIGLERIAVMAALNLSHELLQAKSQAAQQGAEDDQMRRLSDKLDQALEHFNS